MWTVQNKTRVLNIIIHLLLQITRSRAEQSTVYPALCGQTQTHSLTGAEALCWLQCVYACVCVCGSHPSILSQSHLWSSGCFLTHNTQEYISLHIYVVCSYWKKLQANEKWWAPLQPLCHHNMSLYPTILLLWNSGYFNARLFKVYRKPLTI